MTAKPPRIICAAVRRQDGCVVAGPRHFDGTMWSVILEITLDQFRELQATGVGDPKHIPAVEKWAGVHAEEGFVDQFGVFYTREEAWPVALANGQILQHELDSKWQIGKLHSEHLY